MAVLNARKYDATLSLVKQAELSMTPEELKVWKRGRSTPRPCNCYETSGFLEADAQLKSGDLGPGTVFACDRCGAQKKVVHLGLPQGSERTDAKGKKEYYETVPLGWRNVTQGQNIDGEPA